MDIIINEQGFQWERGKVVRESDRGQPGISLPAKTGSNFTDKWRLLGRYSSLANERPRRLLCFCNDTIMYFMAINWLEVTAIFKQF
jgi:hypothetical protein